MAGISPGCPAIGPGQEQSFTQQCIWEAGVQTMTFLPTPPRGVFAMAGIALCPTAIWMEGKNERGTRSRFWRDHRASAASVQ